jgi:hypothetical protein
MRPIEPKKPLMEQVWKHLKEKLDVYVTMILAVLGSIFSILNLIDVNVLISLTLATLAFLGFNILRNRWTDDKMQTMMKYIGKHISFETRIYESQEEAVQYVENHIKSTHQKEATLILYSLATMEGLIKKLLEANIKVTTYIQHEETAQMIGSNLQKSRIQSSFDHLPSYIAEPLLLNQLEVYKYDAPGSISGIKIGEELLCIGWYVYERTDANNEAFLGKESIRGKDRYQIFGHNKAAIVVTKDSYGYNQLVNTFNASVENHKRNSLRVFPEEKAASNVNAPALNNSPSQGPAHDEANEELKKTINELVMKNSSLEKKLEYYYNGPSTRM